MDNDYAKIIKFIKNIKYFEEHYTIPEKVEFGRDTQKKYFGSEENKICRFCNDGENQTFEKKAHAFPELIGNKKIFSYYECDKCNEFFGENIENDLGEFLGGIRAVLGIKGKKVKQKHVDKKLKIINEGKNKPVQLRVKNKESVIIDKKNKKVVIKIDGGEYRPVAVYKCFVKMAISIIKENEINNLQYNIKWIKDNKYNSNKSMIKPLPLYYSFTPGPKDFENGSALVFKRKEFYDYFIPRKKNVPYIIFILLLGNFTFQVNIFSDNDIKYFNNLTFSLAFFPVLQDIEYINKFGETLYYSIDMSSNELTQQDRNITLRYSEEILMPLCYQPL